MAFDVTFHGTLRPPFGQQLDATPLAGWHMSRIRVGVTMDLRPGDYYAEILVDDSVLQIAGPHVVDPPDGMIFTLIPPLAGGQVYGLRYYRVHEGVRRYIGVEESE